MLKMLSRPLSLLISVAGGNAASAVLTRIWRLVTGAGDAPQATDRDHGRWEVLVAAGVQSAVIAVANAASDRGAAARFGKFTQNMAR